MEIARILLIVLGALLAVGLVALVVWLIARPKKELPVNNGSKESCFDGTTLQLIGMRLLSLLLTTITLGIGYPWVICMMKRWETKHTVINGRRLKFTGKGLQLLGKYLLWCFLTVITLGIFGLWMGLHIKKWVVKHTVYADGESTEESRFTGGAGGYLGIHLLKWLVTVVTFGLGAAWGQKKVLQWEAKHTCIGGSALYFGGTGWQLFGKYLVLALLTPLTLGIYAIFFPVKLRKWQWSHTEAVYQLPHIQAQSREHESRALQDFARFQVAERDAQIAMLASGMTGNETRERLRELAEAGNPYAAYRLAAAVKAETGSDSEEARALLRQASQGGYHQAMLEQADLTGDSVLWEQAAVRGSGEAAWRLKQYYSTRVRSADNLRKTAYWFYMARQWNIPEAVEAQREYDLLVRDLAIAISKFSLVNQSGGAGKVVAIVLAVVLGLAALGLIGGAVLGYVLNLEKPVIGAAREGGSDLESISMSDYDLTEQGNGLYIDDQGNVYVSQGDAVVAVTDSDAQTALTGSYIYLREARWNEFEECYYHYGGWFDFYEDGTCS